MRPNRSWLMASITALGLVSACNRATPPGETITTKRSAVVAGLGTLTWTLPSWADPLQVPLVALNELRINDRARVLGATLSPGDVASLGGPDTNLGTDTLVDDVTSTANVFLRERAIVSGNLTTAGTVTRQNQVQTLGTVTEHATLARGNVTLGLDLGAAGPDVQSSTTPVLEPGRYGTVLVRGGSITLRSGVYKINHLFVDPGMRVNVDVTAGPAVVLVANTFIMHGKAEKPGGGFPQWVVAYAGTADLFVGSTLDGTFVAPNAKVNMGVGFAEHTGSIVARGIELHQDGKFTHQPYPEGLEALRRLFGLPPLEPDCPFSVPIVAAGRNGHDASHTPRVIAYAGFNDEDELAEGWDEHVAATAAAWGDFDGDGLQELAVGRSAHDGGRLVIYDDANNGMELINDQLLRHWGSQFGVTAVAVGDIDNDDLPEIAVSRQGNDGIEVALLDDAVHGFTQILEFGVGGRTVHDMAFGDADNDGRLELLIARDGRDDNGDGRIVVMQDASEGYARSDFADWGPTDRSATAVAIGNLDGDEVAEIAVGRDAGENARLLLYRYSAADNRYHQVADFGFWGDTRAATKLAFGDLDGDGNDELVAGRNGSGGDAGSRVLVYDTPISSNGLPRVVTELGEGWGDERSVTSLAIGDIDDDGRGEILAGRSVGDGPRVIVYDDSPGGFREIRNFGDGWGDDRSARSLAVSQTRYCQSKPPAPLPPSVGEAERTFSMRRADIIRNWLRRFMPQLQAGGGNTSGAFAREIFGPWDETNTHQAMRKILAGGAAIKHNLQPEAGTLVGLGFPALMNRYIVDNVTMFKDAGTGEDFDFEMMELLEVAYAFEGVSLPGGGGPLLSDAAIRALFLFESAISFAQHDYEDYRFQGIGPPTAFGDIVPYTTNVPHRVEFQTFIVDVPETENHIMMLNTWAYLANQWIVQNRRGLPPVWAEPGAYQNDGSSLEQFLLAALGRFVHNGSWETNARPYQALTMRALQLLASYAPPDSKIQRGAINALDTLATKFAFQSLHGKRIAPMRRNWDGHRHNLHAYRNNYVAAQFGVLTGVLVFDTDPDCTGRLCPYSDGSLRGFALDSALMEYRVPATIVDFMLRPDNHNPGFGAWSRMHDRFSERHFLRSKDPRYPVPNPLREQPDLNQEIADGSLEIEPQAELYFITQDFMNTAGGRGEHYSGFGPIPGPVPDHVYYDNDFLSKPTMLIGGRDLGYWRELPGAAQETMVLAGGSPDWDTNNTGVYKNLAFGFSSGSPATRAPLHWQPADAPRADLGDATFFVVDSSAVGSVFVNPDYYVVVGQFPALPLPVGPRSWAMWEVVPRALAPSAQALLNQVLAANASNSMSMSGGYEYTTATSAEKLSFSLSYPSGRPFTAIDGSTQAVGDLHLKVTPANMPFMDVRQVNARYGFTGVSYVCASGDGRVIINNPSRQERMVIDSRNHLQPAARSVRATAANEPDPCSNGFPIPTGAGGAGGAGGVGGAGGAGGAGGTSPLSTQLTVTNDWNAGYCVSLNVRNSSTTSAATSFTVSLNTNGATIYNSWNGTFSAMNGAITINPLEWNARLDPGETDTSIGFCANRAVAGTTLPQIVSTTGTF